MQFDKLLEVKTSGAVSTTASTTAVAMTLVPNREFTCVIPVTSVKTSASNETYVLAVQVATTSGGTYTTVGTIPAVQTTGAKVYRVPLSGKWIENLNATAVWIRITHTLGGTDPSVTFSAYVTKV